MRLFLSWSNWDHDRAISATNKNGDSFIGIHCLYSRLKLLDSRNIGITYPYDDIADTQACPSSCPFTHIGNLRPKKLMPRLQSLFARTHLRKEEIDLLRGIAKQMLLRK